MLPKDPSLQKSLAETGLGRTVVIFPCYPAFMSLLIRGITSPLTYDWGSGQFGCHTTLPSGLLLKGHCPGSLSMLLPMGEELVGPRGRAHPESWPVLPDLISGTRSPASRACLGLSPGFALLRTNHSAMMGISRLEGRARGSCWLESRKQSVDI